MLFGISPLQCLYASVPAGRHKASRLTGRQVNWQAGKNASGSQI